MVAKKKAKRVVKRREIKPPATPQVQEPEPVPVKQTEIPGQGCSVCGGPIAEGQTYVCLQHIRRD